MIDCKRLKRFFNEKAEEYLRYFEHFSLKNLFKVAARYHFKHLKMKRFGYILTAHKIKRSFNRAAGTYDHSCQVQTAAGEHLIQLLHQHPLSIRECAIDLGCGTGIVTEKLARSISFLEFHAIDIADQLLIKAKPRLIPHGVSVYPMDFDQLSLDKKSFDLIFSNMALHWSKDFSFLLHTLHAYLSPSGILAFSIPLTGTFTELQHYAALNAFHASQEVTATLEKMGYTLCAHHQEKKIISFDHPLAALQSIKKTGANCVHERKKAGLQGKSLLKQLAVTQLTYVIGYFLAMPCAVKT